MSRLTAWSGDVVVEGQRLAVDVRGDDPTLLLVNGVGASRAMWERLRAALPPEVGTVAYDAPGCGASGPARSSLSVTDQARLAAGVARGVGLTHVDVLGFSFGGMIAQDMACHTPDLVRRLALVSTGFGIGSWPGSSVALGLLASPHLLSSPAAIESLGEYVFGGDGLPARSHADRRRALYGAVADPPSFVGQLLAGAAWSSLPWLGSLRQRTLIVAGDRDPLIPVCNAMTMAALIRRTQLHVVRGGGHLLVVDRADEVAGAIARFLAAK